MRYNIKKILIAWALFALASFALLIVCKHIESLKGIGYDLIIEAVVLIFIFIVALKDEHSTGLERLYLFGGIYSAYLVAIYVVLSFYTQLLELIRLYGNKPDAFKMLYISTMFILFATTISAITYAMSKSSYFINRD